MIEFKCRASAAGKLMTNQKSAKDALSQTTKSYLDEWMKEIIYGVRREITSKQIEKGLEYEDQAIDKVIEWLDLPLALKNKERFKDEYFEGEPDLLVGNCVIDIKNSWDCFTFPLFADEIPTDDYEYQVQVYMHLTGLKKAKVVYVLLNTPETKWTPEIDYSNVPINCRYKVFSFEYDEAIIEKLKTRVISARDYINQYKHLLNK